MLDFDFEPTVYELTITECLAAGAEGVMISNEHYHALEGISGSHLPLLAESNKHLDNKRLFSPDSPALKFGTLFHTFALEPDKIASRYVVMPEKFEPKAVTGVSIEQSKKDFIKANNHKEAVTYEDYKKAQKMARNVNAICGNIINEGIRERSLFVKINNIILKCRLDIDLSNGDDYDLKSISLGTKEFSNYVLEQHIKKFHYCWSAAFRNIIRRKLGLPVRHSYLIFCNTAAGNMVRVIKIAPEWIVEAEDVVLELLSSRSYYLKHDIDNDVVEIDDSKRIYR